MMSCRALKMSMLSSNVATTCDSPNFEIERTFCRPGKPLMASSTGSVICASVSCGFSAAAVVLICTCTGVVSGKASIGRMLKAPPADDDERRRQHADQQAVLEREVDDPV